MTLFTPGPDKARYRRIGARGVGRDRVRRPARPCASPTAP